MRKKRILIIESVRDDVCLKRQQNLTRNRDIRQIYELSYVFCVEPEDLLHVKLPETPESVIRDAGNFGTKLPLWSVKNRLAFRMAAQMDTFKPDCLVLYAGFVYRQYKGDIVSVLRTIRKRYPGIEYGCISGGVVGIDNSHDLFGNNDMLLNVQANIRRAMLPGH